MNKLNLNGKKIVFVGSTGVGKTTVRKMISYKTNISSYSTDMCEYPEKEGFDFLKCILRDCNAFHLIEIGSSCLSHISDEDFNELKDILDKEAFVIYLKPTNDNDYNIQFLNRVVKLRDGNGYFGHDWLIDKNSEANPVGSFYKKVANLTIYTLPEKLDLETNKYLESFYYYDHLRHSVADEIIDHLYNLFEVINVN